MDKALWAAQIFVAMVFTVTGGLKVLVPREKLATKMHWASEWTDARVKLLGVAEVLGAVGLIAPLASGVAPFLTPLAALCLALLLVGAVYTHRRLGEGYAPAVLVLALCLVIAVGRAP